MNKNNSLKKEDGTKIIMPVIFELKPNTRHAAKQRRGFLRYLGFAVIAVLASVGSMESNEIEGN
ncbi:hypothetical protein [Methylotenera sp.]|uniref:hypothetical protein n=1 Tax=Methylotenera sp. TaxID=2051956 RepID=UPI00272F2F0C|nr:hypothetical protein [Methylotenera sp.]MDP2229928.1 hypothetical protein [Methylotenera sp.]MDP3141135.1 hypothetical protein [Methylotenera sp.]